MGPDANTTPPALAGILAHELTHLISMGQRLSPYLPTGPNSVPSWFGKDVFIDEGMANLALAWSGQSYGDAFAYLVAQPQEMTLSRLLLDQYPTDPTLDVLCYGMGALAVEYLFDQAGAVSITGPGTLQNLGGIEYLMALTLRPEGLARLAPLDGRAVESWYPDLAGALLVTALPGLVSSTTAKNPAYTWAKTIADPTYGGFDGPTLLWEQTGYGTEGPILPLTPWSERSSTMKRGGMSFVSFQLAEPSELAIEGASSVALLIRHKAP
jgi:hypothetical protein